MSLKQYGVLVCHAKQGKADPVSDQTPHYQVLVSDQQNQYRIAINVKSKQAPSELLYLVKEDFQHPITAELSQLKLGFHRLNSQAGGMALDYIRGNLFQVKDMKPLPFDIPGPDNDLKELIDLYIKRAIQEPEAVMYAFGEPWGPEMNQSDAYFHFRPGRGIHDIHMNQGNSGSFTQDNGVWQDGGLLIHYPQRQQWVAVFLAFQSQCFHTDDQTGNRLAEICDHEPKPSDKEEAVVKIIAALVNPSGDDMGKETVTLINCSDREIDLEGWAIADRLKRKQPISGLKLAAGVTTTIKLSGETAQLSNQGGAITLLNPEGIKIHGVSYTKEDASKSGWTIVF